MIAEKDVHVLIVAYPLQGHLNPTLRFAKHLVSKNIHVTLATLESARHRLHINSTIPRLEWEFIPDGLDNNINHSQLSGSNYESLKKIGSENLSSLVTNLSRNFNRKFSYFIASSFVPWVVDVAWKHEIPCAILWIQACAVFSIYIHLFRNAHLFTSVDTYENATIELPGLPSVKVDDLPSFLLPSCPTYIRNMLSDFFLEGLNKVKWVLGNSFYELEKDVVNSMDSFKEILSIGPLVSPFMLGKKKTITSNVHIWNAENSCLEWLEKKSKSSVIYISFGSILVFSQEQMDNITMALKNTYHSFIWVIKHIDKGSDKKCGDLSLEFLEETKEKGLIIEWCPQEKILMHEAIACFMTHCGWNSTLESVVSGVPVIGYPEWTDQPTDAKLLADVFKTGVRIRKGEDGLVSMEKIERCIFEVTDGPQSKEMKKRAMELKKAATQAIDDCGSSEYNLNQFVNEIMNNSY
ncbi:hypothetical protein ACFE04_024333 [Oxalis oulophora]